MIDGFLMPAGLALFALSIPIVLTYMLKTRRPRKTVPSTFLWDKALLNVAASRPWQRVRPSILLFLQLLFLAILAVIFARPFTSTRGVGGKHLVLVIDASGSMLSTDEAPSRIEAARREALDLIETLPEGGLVSVISATTRPRVVVSSSADLTAVRRALRSVRPTEGSSNFSEALLLAESLETPERPATIAVISDGGLTTEETSLIPPGTVFRGVGRSGTNLAITRLDVAEGPSGFTAFIEVRNFGARVRSSELTLLIDESPFTSLDLDLPAGKAVERSVELGSQTGRLTARISSEDPLAADDRAFAVLERTRPTRILLVTPGNIFLESLLQQLPGASIEVRTEVGSSSGFDMAVFDRVAAPQEIELPALFVAPTKPPTGVTVEGFVDAPSINYLSAGDPLLAEVDLSDVAIARVQRASIPLGRTLVGVRATDSSVETPAISVWADGPLRRAWWGFDLHETNLPLQVAFPILADHLLGWLKGVDEIGSRYAGEPILPPAPPGTTSVTVDSPGGAGARLEPGEPFEDTAAAGFYRMEFRAEDKLIAERTLALSFPPSESELLPRGLQAAGGEAARPGLVDRARRALGPTIIAAALFLSVFEWWWGSGRPTPPRRRQPRVAGVVHRRAM